MNPQTERIWQVNQEVGIESLVTTGNGRIWAGSRNGLFWIDRSFYFERVTQLPTDVRIRSLYVDHLKQLWIGTENAGLFVIVNPNDNEQKLIIKNFRHTPKYPFSINEGTIYAITQDSYRNIWVGIENGGVNIVQANELKSNKPKFQHLEHTPFDTYTLANNSVHTLYCAQQNTVWVGTYGN
jgi:ligand-binding sensor domain-containing protein